MMDSLPSDRRTFGFAITNLPQLVSIFAPPIGGYIVYKMGIIPGMRLNYLLYFLLAFSAALIRLRLKETLPFPLRKLELKKTIDKALKIWKSVKKEMHYVLYANITFNFVNGLTTAFFVLYATSYVSTFLWGITIAMVIGTQSLSGLWVSNIADKGFKKEFFIVGLALLSISNILFIFPSVVFLFIFAFMRGLGIAFHNPSKNSLIADFVSTEKRGRVMGSLLFFSYLGGMLGAFLGGHIYHSFHTLPFILSSWILLILCLFLYYLFRKLDIGISPLHA